MSLLPKLTPRSMEERKVAIRRNMMHKEAVMGGKLFGPVPKGHQRQFFCMDDHTWIWHETWTDSSGRQRSVTTRYELRSDGVIKVQGGHTYQSLSRSEARNLFEAIKMYMQRVGEDYGRIVHAA